MRSKAAAAVFLAAILSLAERPAGERAARAARPGTAVQAAPAAQAATPRPRLVLPPLEITELRDAVSEDPAHEHEHARSSRPQAPSGR